MLADGISESSMMADTIKRTAAIAVKARINESKSFCGIFFMIHLPNSNPLMTTGARQRFKSKVC
jgi:hypothetical protein